MSATRPRVTKPQTRSALRQAQAIELRRAGRSFSEIAASIGCGKSQAHRLVHAALLETRAQIAAQSEELKAEEISRLDALLGSLWAKARGGDLQAVDRVLKISERRSKLLGLDAPVRMAHGGDDEAEPIRHSHVHEYTDDELIAIIRRGRR